MLLHLFEQCKPKNFQIKRMFRIDNESSLIPVNRLKPGEVGKIEYFFGGQEYIHVGEWPIQEARPRFVIPIHSARLEDGTECTEIVRKYCGGPTQSPPDFNTYAPAPHLEFSLFRVTLGVKWRLVKRNTPKFHIVDIFTQLLEPNKI